jgi:hypothetical protein
MSQDFGMTSDVFERSRVMREQRVAEMMEQVVYPANVGREALCLDTPWASTIAEAVGFAFDESAVPDDMQDMVRVSGNIDLMLRERHIADIAMYVRDGTTAVNGGYHILGIDTIGGHQFEEDILSKAFGYAWYRKCSFALPVGRFVFLRPGMQPWIVGGSPFPRAYATSDVDRTEVNRIVSELCIM